MQNRICAIIVSYHYPRKFLIKLEKDLIREGISKDSIVIHYNDKENIGYGEGINKEIKSRINQYEFFLLLNPDINIKKGFLKPLISTFERSVEVGVVGPKILGVNGEIWAVGGEIEKLRYSGTLAHHREKNIDDKRTVLVDFVSGTAMMVKSEVFRKVGLFSSDYFLYYEDVDFCIRAKRAGFKCIINTVSVIVHIESSTTGKNSPLQQYYLARNHLLLLEKHGPFIAKLHEILRLPKTIYEARSRKFELLGIRDFFLRRFGKNENWS